MLFTLTLLLLRFNSVNSNVLFHKKRLVKSKRFNHRLLLLKEHVSILVVFLNAKHTSHDLGAFRLLVVLLGRNRSKPHLLDLANRFKMLLELFGCTFER